MSLEDLSKKLEIADLDFDTIKNSLKDFLRGQDEFKDFDFEGSGMNYLLDLLSYNTHYQSFYTNMVANEMFLDTALKRDSVVSLAKHMGYTPNSIRAATATVNLTGASETTILRGTPIKGTVDSVTYNFVPIDDISINATGDAGLFGADNVVIYEGTLETTSFVVDNTDPSQKFILQENADTSTLTVRVQNSLTDSTGYSTKWQLASDLNEVKDTDKVYHLQEVENGRFEIFFGDNIVGEKPTDGNVIVCQYVLTSGDAANGVGRNDLVPGAVSGLRSFTLSNFTVDTIASAAGGSQPETIRSIKYHAPRSYAAQDRSVTSTDFGTMLVRDYADIESAFVWGGQDNDPPEYGKIFVALKPKVGLTLDDATKLQIINDIKRKRTIVSIIPEIKDPDPIYLRFDVKTIFDQSKTNLGKGGIEDLIKVQLRSYVDEELEKFGVDLYFSKLTGLLDNVSDSIVGNEMKIELEKRFTPSFTFIGNYDLKFNNPISHPHDGHIPVISSTGFNYKDDAGTAFIGFLEDDGFGGMRIFKIDSNGVKTIIYNNVGTIDYITGFINIKDFRPTGIEGSTEIRVYAKPADQNIFSDREQLLTFDAFDGSALSVQAKNTLTQADERFIRSQSRGGIINPVTNTISQATGTFAVGESASSTESTGSSGTSTGGSSSSGSGGGSSSSGSGSGGGGYGGGY